MYPSTALKILAIMFFIMLSAFMIFLYIEREKDVKELHDFYEKRIESLNNMNEKKVIKDFVKKKDDQIIDELILEEKKEKIKDFVSDDNVLADIENKKEQIKDFLN